MSLAIILIFFQPINHDKKKLLVINHLLWKSINRNISIQIELAYDRQQTPVMYCSLLFVTRNGTERDATDEKAKWTRSISTRWGVLALAREDFVIAGNERTMGRAKRARWQRRRETKAGEAEGEEEEVVDAKETVLRSFGGGR